MRNGSRKARRARKLTAQKRGVSFFHDKPMTNGEYVVGVPKRPANRYALIDSWERAERYPDTWATPDYLTINRLKVGDYVLVGVERSVSGEIPTGERFWARIAAIIPKPFGFTVVVEQDDMQVTEAHGIASGDTLSVSPRHIMNVLAAPMTEQQLADKIREQDNMCSMCEHPFGSFAQLGREADAPIEQTHPDKFIELRRGPGSADLVGRLVCQICFRLMEEGGYRDPLVRGTPGTSVHYRPNELPPQTEMVQ